MAYAFKTYERAPAIAYKALKLIDPAARASYPDPLLELGTFRIIENEATVLAIVAEYLRELSAISKKIDSEYEALTGSTHSNPYAENGVDARKGQVLQELRRRCVLSFDDYQRFIGQEEAEAKRLEEWQDWGEYQRGAARVRRYARSRFAELQAFGGFSPTFAGYQTYLRAANKKLHQVLSQELPALMPEKPRRTHTYIVSTTETGKTELLKALCLNYIQQPNYAGVVVLDPGGDMAPQMARWSDLIPTGQLVYIDPMLSKFNAPVINPFDAEHLSPADRMLLTDEIVLAIGALVEGKQGGSLSVNMETILYPCVRLLIDLPNTSLLDLIELMKDDEQLLSAGCQSKDAVFFQSEWKLQPKVTKQSILSKLRNILNKGVLDKVLCGRTTINLEQLMAERKFIVVNLAKGRLTPSESTAFGTLLVSLIQAIAMKRQRLAETERPMTHLIIDECHNFVTSSLKTIIRETRKFGLAVTLAQQEVGAEMHPDLEKTVTRTTNVKVAGRSEIMETKRSGSLVGVPAESITGLPAGQFYWKNGGTAPPFLLHVRSDRIEYKGGVSNETWLQVANQQQRYFYRRHDGAVPAALAVEETEPTKQPAEPEPATKSGSDLDPDPALKKRRYEFE